MRNRRFESGLISAAESLKRPASFTDDSQLIVAGQGFRRGHENIKITTPEDIFRRVHN